MDAISYSHSVKQEKRIKKFIENPDSNSGVLTQPKVIEAGETVTIKSGRKAILADTVVEGDLVIEAGGEVFVPSGSSVDFSNGIKVNGEKLVMSIPTAYHIYNGSVEATNTEITNGFSTTLYTGNGVTQSINTGVDMATQWGDDASETFGGLVWIKSRSAATNNFLFDTIRGALNEINSNTTEAQASLANSLTAFNNNGFSVGSAAGINVNAATYVSWNFQTTHRRTGVTNHGKAYTEHYNPFTGFTIIKYEGSGIAGHEIPHSLGRELGFVTVKNLTSTDYWKVGTEYGSGFLEQNLALANSWGVTAISGADKVVLPFFNVLTNDINYSSQQYIMYGWANSYYDESNKLIGNYEIGVYQGTGVAGNKVKTRGKPAWIMVKRLDAIGNWTIIDNLRSYKALYPNASAPDSTDTEGMFVSDGFVFTDPANNFAINTSGGQYLYMVVYDNDSGSGKSKYPKATDTTNLSINALVPYANGIDVNGSKVSIEYKNETITGLTLTEGKNYLYSKNDGTYGVSMIAPSYGSLRNRSVAGENPDYFDLKTMKWYETTGGELITNGTFDTDTSGWTTVNQPSNIIWENGRLKMVNTTGTTADVYQQIPVTAGKTITIKATIQLGTQVGAYIALGTTNNINDLYYSSNFTGTKVISYTPSVTGTIFIRLGSNDNTTGRTAYFDNISVFETTPTIGAETTPRTYLDCVVHADQNGQVSYVEELPKIEYKDVIKANEYQGKNACTALVVYDDTTTPPTIKESINIASIIKVSSSQVDIYFKDEMDTDTYSITKSSGNQGVLSGTLYTTYKPFNIGKKKFSINSYAPDVGGYTNNYNSIQIFGGKN